jgi:ribosomal protein S17
VLAPAAVKVELLPAQIIVGLAVVVSEGIERTVTVVVNELVPHPEEPITV